MVNNTNKQASASYENLTHNLRSINIQDLWSHDQRHVSNTGSSVLAFCSSQPGPGRSSLAASAVIEDRNEGANEAEAVVERITPSMTGAQRTGDSGLGSFLAVYRGLDWNDSLAMLNWRLQEAYAEKDRFASITTGTTPSSVLSTAMSSDAPEPIAEETIVQEAAVPEAILEEIIAGGAIEEGVISPLELEPCYSIASFGGSNDNDRDSEGVSPQETSPSFPRLENLASESAPTPPENIYRGLSWTDRLRTLNGNLQEAYEKNDAGNPKNSPINTTHPQITFYAEDPLVLPHSHAPGLPLFIPDPSPPPNPPAQQPSLHYQPAVYPTHEPNWGPYPGFPQQKPQVPHHLFCPSAAHAATCGGIFVDPRAAAAIDHVVYNSAMMMFENFRRQFLAMEGKPNVGWGPVEGSELDTRGATLTPAPVVNDPGVFGETSEQGAADNGVNKEPHREIREEVNKETEVENKVDAWPPIAAQNSTTNNIDTQSITARSTMQDSGTQADPEAVPNQLGAAETSNTQTKATETASVGNFGMQTNVPEVVPAKKPVSSSAQTTSTKTKSKGTSTDAKIPLAQVHSPPETRPQQPATRKYKYRRKNKAKNDTSAVEQPPPPSPPPPQPLFSTIPCESLNIAEQTITYIAIDEVRKTSPEPFIQSGPISTLPEQDEEQATASFKLKAQGTTAQSNLFKTMMFCSLLFLVLDLALGPEGDR